VIIIIIPDNPTLLGRRHQIAKSMVDRGHQVYFLTWENPYHIHGKKLLFHIFTAMRTAEHPYDTITVHKMARLPFYWPYINGLLFKYQLKRLYKRIGADLIFTESYTNETEIPKSLPYIYDLSDDYSAPADLYGSPVYKLAFKLLGVRNVMKRQCENAIAVTAVSDILCKYAKHYNKRTFKLVNGVDIEPVIATLKDESSYSMNKHSIVYVSTFGEWSRVIETMQNVIELRAKFPKIDLTLIGNGSEVGKIKQFIKENKVSNFIHFKGLVRNRLQLFKYINQSTVGLNISKKDKFREAAFPVKVMEYTALGKKVVSTNLPEVSALNFPNVFIFSDNKKSSTLKETMEKALEYNNRKNEYKSTSSFVLKNYSWDKITDDFLDIINKVIER
jgi:glycosyltransferase involved in cell wall biosynthesis